MTVRRIGRETGEAIEAAHQRWADGAINATEYRRKCREILGKDTEHMDVYGCQP